MNIRSKKQRRPQSENFEEFPDLIAPEENISLNDNAVPLESQTSNVSQCTNQNRTIENQSTEHLSSNENNKRNDPNYNRKSEER